MSIAITQTIHVLQIIVQTVPVGTNLALLQLMWTMLNGSFLQSRGAIFPALKANGFSAEESRRIWRAFRQGIWRINECIARWHNHVFFCLKENGKAMNMKGIDQSPSIGQHLAVQT